MLFGAIFRCLDPALTIAATLSYKSPFVCSILVSISFYAFLNKNVDNDKIYHSQLTNSTGISIWQERWSRQEKIGICCGKFRSSHYAQCVQGICWWTSPKRGYDMMYM